MENSNNHLSDFLLLNYRAERLNIKKYKDTLLVKALTMVQSVLKLIGYVLRDAGIELVFILGFTAVIIWMSQGRDLIVSMFEPGGIYNISRIIYTLLSIVAISVSMWIIPAFLFELRNDFSRVSKIQKDAFGDHLFFAHRILSLIPFWLMAFALFNSDGLFFSAMAIVELIILSVCVSPDNAGFRKKLSWSVFSLLAILTYLFFINFQEEYLLTKRLLAGMLYLISMLMFLLYYEIDLRILSEHKNGKKHISHFWRYPVNSIFFVSYGLLHVVILSVILLQKTTLQIAPESMLLYIFAVYIFFIDLFAYLFRLHPLVRSIGNVIGLLLIVLLLSGKIPLHLDQYTLDRVNLSPKLEKHSLLRIEDYYDAWKSRIKQHTGDEPYPIILVAGEGGGSRAGYWFSQNLISFDQATNGKFRNHIFGMSTVSGSTVGLGTYLSYLAQPTAGTGNNSAANWVDFPQQIYRNNFVGSSITGLLLIDPFHTIFYGGTQDRNNILLTEERVSTNEAIATIQGDTSRNVLNKEFMSLFYDSLQNFRSFKMDFPLVFINTTRGNDGRRGIFSPVRIDSVIFNDALDINSYLYNDSLWCCTRSRVRAPNTKGISFGQASLCSELFPLFSAPVYIDSLGSFVDGGYHENSGLKTTLDVYNELQRLLTQDADSALKNKCEVYILYLKSGDESKDLYKALKPSLPISQPVSAFIGQPFNGSASYFEEKARVIGANSTKVKFIQLGMDKKVLVDPTTKGLNKDSIRIQVEILADLKQKKDTSSLNFPLARWLSTNVLVRMRQSHERLMKDTTSDLSKLLVQIDKND